jgi:pyruvate dehydrogenase E2 component (dihydrolipoamide acetyltransferase)
MAEIIEMPKLSDTMEEGAIAAWLKKEGEFVEEGEALVEIETDKATMEYNSPEEGYLLKIIVPSGEGCQLNAPIAVLGEKGESFDLASLSGKTSAGATPPPPPPPPPVAQLAHSESAVAPKVATQTIEPSNQSGRLRSSPLARKLAKDHAINLASITGTGPSGRVIAADVENALASSGQSEARPSMPADVGVQFPSSSEGLVYEDLPNSMMRKTIAKRLLAAKNEAPHFYLTISADMTESIAWRKSLNADEKATKVSVNDLVILAVSKALIKHPEVNASWNGQSIRRYKGVDISMAVAVTDGLITPVIKGADKLGVREIARLSKALAQKAYANELRPEEYQGGTFSISNLGMMGIEEFTAIINPPQSAILAVGAMIPTPWVDQETGEISVKPRMKMTMSCDHRVIDGALGATFLATLKRYLEDPLSMLA